MFDTTIAGIATSLSPAGISIIRISGKDSIEIVNKIFRFSKGQLDYSYKNKIIYGHIVYKDEIIDEVLVSVFIAPNSYTAENVVEINCHGGVLVTKRILRILLEEGASLAGAGEFTKRAFLNGRIDLSRAEAIADIINAENNCSLKNASRLLDGALSKNINSLRDEILKNCANIEALLDDPVNFEFKSYDKFVPELHEMVSKLDKLIKSFDRGNIINSGIDTLILGRPNVGKSSLLNALSNDEIAIVTDIAGTTRDLIKERISINDLSLNIIDSAGIRNTDDKVEKIGIDRSLDYIDKANLILLIIDGSNNIDEIDIDLIDRIKDKRAIIVINKVDLGIRLNLDMFKSYKSLCISIKENKGIDELRAMISNIFLGGLVDEENDYFITNVRQLESLKEAKTSLEAVIESANNEMPEDFLSIDLMAAYDSLSEIIGEKNSDALADEIFANFCMGK